MASLILRRGYGLRPLHIRAQSALGTPSTSDPKQFLSKKRLSPENRLLKFTALYDFVTPRLGCRPVIKTPQVRNSAWIHLMGLANNEEMLTKVAELFPKWKDSRREFGPEVGEAFVRRCEELTCPQLALQVFGDHSKYSLPLSLPAARHLLHSLHSKHPIQDTIAAASLYGVYKLPPVSTDLISCSLLASACLKAGMRDASADFSIEHDKELDGVTKEKEVLIKAARRVQRGARRVGLGLVPSLKTMLKTTRPIRARTRAKVVPVKGKGADRNDMRGRVWLKWTLAKIQKALEVKGKDVGWLRMWRMRSGHVTDGTHVLTEGPQGSTVAATP